MLRRYSVVIFLIFVFQAVASGQAPQQSAKKTQEPRFEKAIVAYEKKSLENPPPENCTMFVGSSTWTLWAELLEKDFVEFKAVNRGFGGATIPDLIRAADRLVTPHKPARILFFCGGNDINSSATPDEVFKNFQTYLEKIHTAAPKCQVYFVSITRAPVREKSWNQTQEVNAKVRELCKELDYLHYINTVDLMNDKTGRTREDLYLADRLHLNRKAQEEIWIPTIKEAVIKTEKLPLTLGQ